MIGKKLKKKKEELKFIEGDTYNIRCATFLFTYCISYFPFVVVVVTDNTTDRYNDRHFIGYDRMMSDFKRFFCFSAINAIIFFEVYIFGWTV